VIDDTEILTREVDERLRHERQLALLRKYGPWLAGLALAALLGLIAWVLYQGWRENAARKQFDAFIAADEALRTGDNAGAAKQFEDLSAKGPKVYRVLALMRRAGVLEQQGDLPGALAQFDAAAAAADDPIQRDTARLRAAYIVADTQDFQAVRARLEPLIAEGGQLGYLARELLGVEAWEAGDVALARQTLDALYYALDAPESVRQRVEIARSVLGPAPGGDAPATPAAAPPASPAATKTGDAR